MAKQIRPEDAVTMVKGGSTVMIGGFLGAAVPLKMIDQLAESDIKEITLITIGAGYRGSGVDSGHDYHR